MSCVWCRVVAEYKVDMLLGKKVVVEFINGSQLAGILLSISEKQYVLDTGKELPEFIERANVKLVRPFEVRHG